MNAFLKFLAEAGLFVLTSFSGFGQLEVRSPSKIYVERFGNIAYVNFDFLIRNLSSDTLLLQRVLVTALNQQGTVVHRQVLNSQALAPSIATLPQRMVLPGSALHLFNPFYALPADLAYRQLVYDFDFSGSRSGHHVSDTVVPQFYRAQTQLASPLKGKVFVYDGHDFYSHHRRIDYTHPVAIAMQLQQTASLFANDLCTVGENNRLYKGQGTKAQDWFGYGQPVYAPGNGIIRDLRDTVPDNELDPAGKVIQKGSIDLGDPATFSGNYIIIDHVNGEYSLLAHFQKGSIRVHVGQPVKKGQLLGRMGFSGSTGNYVHIHYELRNSSHPWKADGLPYRFTNIKVLYRATGASTYINTGDFYLAK